VGKEFLKIATICTGNICRSPMAEVFLRDLVEHDPSLNGRVIVTSAGTANWHVGDPMDARARAALNRAGLTGPGAPAAYADSSYLEEQDVVLVMTNEHRADVRRRLINASPTVLLWRTFVEPDHDLDVADPYYVDERDFDACLGTLRAAGPNLTAVFHQLLDERSHEA
jgi:protein-tyrosine phosphatase